MNFFTGKSSAGSSDSGSRKLSLRPNFLKSNSSRATDVTAKPAAPVDNVPVLIYCAGQCLSNTIEEILSDTSKLTGDNLSGFQRLLDILNDTSTTDDMVQFSRSGGLCCLETLLVHMQHPKFVEVCNEAALATALMHALRLIRMLEIKKCKLEGVDLSTLGSVQTTARVVRLLKHLLSDCKTIEQIRQSLVKLLIFPLGVLPVNALHIQQEAAGIVSAMCRTGFSTQQVWYLHEVMAVTHMVRHLSELSTIGTPDKDRGSDGVEEQLLKGLAAEEAGMWVTGAQCIVDVIQRTLPVSSVLLSDFEAAGGRQLFIHLLKHSGPDRFMLLMHSIISLMFDAEKGPDEALVSTSAGAILLLFLQDILHLEESVKTDMEVRALSSLAGKMYKTRQLHPGFQQMVQSMAYSLLTVYSNNSQNCSLLEETYCYLPSMLLAFPCLQADCISAVLTALNYVCLCVESGSSLPLRAVCAAVGVIVQGALSRIHDEHSSSSSSSSRSRSHSADPQDSPRHNRRGSVRITGSGSGGGGSGSGSSGGGGGGLSEEELCTVQTQLDLIFQTLEGIVRNNARYALQLLHLGLLPQTLLPLQQLLLRVEQGRPVLPQSVVVLKRVVQMLISVLVRAPGAADLVRDCGLSGVLRGLIGAQGVGGELSLMLLRVSCQLAHSSLAHLKDCFLTLFCALRRVSQDFAKMAQLADAVCVVLLENDNCSAQCFEMGGMAYTVEALAVFRGRFKGEGGGLLLSAPHPSSADFASVNTPFRRFYSAIFCSLADSGIFESPHADKGVALVLQLIGGFSTTPGVANAGAAEVLVRLVGRIPPPLGERAVALFAEMVCEVSARELAEAGIVCLIVEQIYPMIQDSLDHPYLALFRQLCCYLTVETFAMLLKYIIRPVLLPRKDDFALMQPWECSSPKHASASWAALRYLTDLTGSERVQSVPHFCLGTMWGGAQGGAYLQVELGGTPGSMFPGEPAAGRAVLAGGFTYAAWIKVPHAGGGGMGVGGARSSSRFTSPSSSGASRVGSFSPTSATSSNTNTPDVSPTTAFAGDGGGAGMGGVGGVGAANESRPQSSRNAERAPQVVPLLSLSLGRSCFLEAHVDPDRSIVRVAAVTKSGAVGILFFAPPLPLRLHDWTLLALGLRRTKTLTAGTKITLSVSVNGLQCLPLTTDSLAVDAAVLASSTEMHVGRLNLSLSPDLTGKFTAEVPESERAMFLSSVPMRDWQQGPLNMFEEQLTQEQVNCVFIKGPKYLGGFAADSPLADDLSAISTHLLYRCNAYQRTADSYLETLGVHLEVEVRGMPVGPVGGYEFPPMPSAILSVSAAQVRVLRAGAGAGTGMGAGGDQGSSVGDQDGNLGMEDDLRQTEPNLTTAEDARVSMRIAGGLLHVPHERCVFPNTAEEGGVPDMQMRNGRLHRRSQSLADCAAALGGPQVLFPLLQAASTSSQLCQVLTLLLHCVRHNLSSLKYMQQEGYKVMAFILSMKPTALLSDSVVTALMQLAVDNTPPNIPGNPTHSPQSAFLIDDAAFYYLLLNHQVWEASRHNITFCLLTAMLALAEDERYALQNAKRLSKLGVTHWVLLITAHSVALLDPSPPPLRSRALSAYRNRKRSWGEKDAVGEEWAFGYPSAVEMAEHRETADPFLHEAMSLVQRVVAADIRRKDIDLLAKLVMYTFLPTGGRSAPPSRRSGSRSRSGSQGSSSRKGVSVSEGGEGEEGEEQYPFCNFAREGEEGEAPFTPMGVFRVYLLRFIFDIYDSYLEEVRRGATSVGSAGDTRRASVRNTENVFEFFRASCSPAWFLALLEQPLLDIATKTYTLRLLGLCLQRDGVFMREFCANEGFKTLQGILHEPQELPVVLPLVAIFLRIPLQVLMHPSQIKSVHSFIQVLNLDETCGTNNAEPALSELTLPLLGLLLDCLAAACRVEDGEAQLQQQDLVHAVGKQEGQGAQEQVEGAEGQVQEEEQVQGGQGGQGGQEGQMQGRQVKCGGKFRPLVDLLFGVLQYAMGRLITYQRLLSHKPSIELLAGALLSCSNAYDDFGAHIFTQGDLTSTMHEDYIQLSGNISLMGGGSWGGVGGVGGARGGSVGGSSLSPSGELSRGGEGEERPSLSRYSLDTPEDQRGVTLTGLGSHMLDLLSSSLTSAITEFETHTTLSYYLTSFPQHLLPHYEHGFQRLVVDSFAGAVERLMVKFEPLLMLHVSELIVMLAPLVKARLLLDQVLFQLLQLTLRLAQMSIDAAVAQRAQVAQEVVLGAQGDRLHNVIKELGNTARVFAHALMSTRDVPRLWVFRLLRENLHVLFHPALEDVGGGEGAQTTSKFLRRTVTLLEGAEGGTGTVLEAVQALGAGAGKRVGVYQLATVKAERNRAAASFWLSTTAVCFGLVLEDDAAVRIEATRILAFLAQSRGPLLEQVLGAPPSSAPHRLWRSTSPEALEEAALKASKEVDIFRDGLSKLVPDGRGRYEVFLRGATDDNDSEDNRFADFSFWVSDNSQKCDRAFAQVEAALAWVVPAAAEVDEILRQVARCPVPARNIAAAAASLRLERGGAAGKRAEQVAAQVQRFQIFGLVFVASGAMAWGSVWSAAQCGPLWGYLPLAPASELETVAETGTSTASTGTGTGTLTSRSSLPTLVAQELVRGESFYCRDPAARFARNSALGKASGGGGNGGGASVGGGAGGSAGSAYRKSWYLNFTEGPECVRRKMEQDFSVQSIATYSTHTHSHSRERQLSLGGAGVEGSSFDPTEESPHKTPGGHGNTSEGDMEDFLKRFSKVTRDLVKGGGGGALMGSGTFDEAEEDEFLIEQAKGEGMGMGMGQGQGMGGMGQGQGMGEMGGMGRVEGGLRDREGSLSAPEHFAVDDYEEYAGAYLDHDLMDHDLDLDFKLAQVQTFTVTETETEAGVGVGVEETETVTDVEVGTEVGTAAVVKEAVASESPEPQPESGSVPMSAVEPEAEPAECADGAVEGGESAGVEGMGVEGAEWTQGVAGPDRGEATIPGALIGGVGVGAVGADVGGGIELTDSAVSSPTKQTAPPTPTPTPAPTPAPTPSSPKKVSTHTQSQKARRGAMLLEVVKGLIGADEWAQGSAYNVHRIYGLEAHTSMLVISPQNIHILCGFIVKNPSRVKKIGTTADCVLEWMSPQQQQDVFDSLNSTNVKEKLALDLPQHDTDWVEEIWKELLRSDLGYSRFPLSEVYSFFRRRYQLKYTAMEVTDVKGYSALYSCESVEENEEVLVRLLQSDLPNSIFNQIGLHQLQLLRSLGGNASSMCRSVYNRLVHLFVTQVTALWKSGELSNFEYLMQINAAAGRSFQDLTQYPVFPWIIADYTSNTLDLEDPRTFRDLTKPMGAIGSRRAQQYRDRYQTMDEFYKDGIEGSSPPFFYGTHYSCAGYVLHYLLRLQPYADMNVSLQGGQFDKADRLFLSVESSWASASSENLQDVRELIPEFFYLPEFLTNLNNFDLGSTQRDEMVKDVTLPPWAHGDPHQFIRLHREALECKYVSENLHHWVDLVFGFKQRGPEAVDSLNVFIHLTYEGEVDIDTIMDPVMKVATISQINNFGQTPLRVFRKPHPPKSVPDIMKRAADSLVLDPWAIAWHTHLSPPLSVVGAPEHSMLSRSSYAQVLFPGNVRGLPVGDVRIVRGDRLVAVPSGSALVPPLFRRAVRIGPYAGAVSMHSIHPALAGARALDSEKELSVHEELHVKPITCLAMAKNGAYFATGGEDTSVRVWRVSRQNSQRRLLHVCTLAGHTAAVMCLDISTELSVVVSGGADSIVCVWDYRMKRMLRILEHSGPLLSVSLNPIGAMIGTLTATQVRLYSINGELISAANPTNPTGNLISVVTQPIQSVRAPSPPPTPQSTLPPSPSLTLAPPTVVLACPCSSWQDGVVLVTGHRDGNVYLWKLSKSSLSPTAEQSAETPLSLRGGAPPRSISPTPRTSPAPMSMSMDLPKGRSDTDSEPLTPSSGSPTRRSRPYQCTNNCSKARELYISAVPMKTHRAQISMLRLCPTGTAKAKEILTRLPSEEWRALDLLVGDAEGYVSRWTPVRLDQLGTTDSRALVHIVAGEGRK